MSKLFFSVVIPVGPRRNVDVLESLKKLNYDKKKYEVIVKEGTNASLNRNNGVREAKGEVIFFLDDDAYVDENLFLNAEKFFNENPEVDIVGGPQLTPVTDGFFAKHCGYVLESFFATSKMRDRYRAGKIDFDGALKLTSANCCVKKKVFEKLEGFSIDLFPGEDPEFFFRARKEGFKVVYNPDLVIYHKRRSNLFSFFKQFFLYGKVAMSKAKRKSTGSGGLLFFMPSLFVSYFIFLPILLFFNIWFILPFLLYFFLAVANSLYFAIKNKTFFGFFLMILLYFVVHISYGLGMIKYFIVRK